MSHFEWYDAVLKLATAFGLSPTDLTDALSADPLSVSSFSPSAPGCSPMTAVVAVRSAGGRVTWLAPAELARWQAVNTALYWHVLPSLDLAGPSSLSDQHAVHSLCSGRLADGRGLIRWAFIASLPLASACAPVVGVPAGPAHRVAGAGLPTSVLSLTPFAAVTRDMLACASLLGLPTPALLVAPGASMLPCPLGGGGGARLLAERDGLPHLAPLGAGTSEANASAIMSTRQLDPWDELCSCWPCKEDLNSAPSNNMPVQTTAGTCTGEALGSAVGTVSDDVPVELCGMHDALTAGDEPSELCTARALAEADAACAPAARRDTLDAPTERGELSELREPCVLAQADAVCALTARSSTITEIALGDELSELCGARALVEADAVRAPAARCDTLDAPTEYGELSELREPCVLAQADAACVLTARSSTITETALAALHNRAALEGGAMSSLPAPISLALQPTRAVLMPCLPAPISLALQPTHAVSPHAHSVPDGWVSEKPLICSKDRHGVCLTGTADGCPLMFSKLLSRALLRVLSSPIITSASAPAMREGGRTTHRLQVSKLKSTGLTALMTHRLQVSKSKSTGQMTLQICLSGGLHWWFTLSSVFTESHWLWTMASVTGSMFCIT